MSRYLPYANFTGVKNIDKIEQKLMNIKSNSSTGCILEVDLEYPHELHDIHNDYPLAIEKIDIPKEWLSDYSLKIVNAHNITPGTVKKLVPNFMSKNNYVIHYRNLQQCLELGMRLNSTHYLIMKINNKRELQNIALNHSAHIDYQNFIKIYRECTKEHYNFLTIDISYQPVIL